MTLDIVIIAFLLVLNGFFSLSEMALVSARKTRLKEIVSGGGPSARGAKTALDLKETPGRFLSTVQIGITMVGIIAGAFGGTQLSGPVEALLAQVPAIAPYAEVTAFTLVVLVITFLTLLIGELVPKNLALARPEPIAATVAPVMALLGRVLIPGVWFLDRVSAAVLKFLGRDGSDTATVTEEEIRYWVEEGAQTGAIERVERDMIYRVIRLGDREAGDLMTPRLRMVTLDKDASAAENLARMRSTPASRFPVVEGPNSEIIGIVRVKDFLRGDTETRDVFEHVHEPIYIPETTPALKVLDILQDTDLHMGIVVDEYGAVQGLVTLTDLMRAVVGDSLAPITPRAATVTRRDDGSYLVDGLKSADDLKELLGAKTLPGEIEHSFHTVGGMIIANLQVLPSEGDYFDWDGHRFEVIDMDGARIDKVLISPIE